MKKRDAQDEVALQEMKSNSTGNVTGEAAIMANIR